MIASSDLRCVVRQLLSFERYGASEYRADQRDSYQTSKQNASGHPDLTGKVLHFGILAMLITKPAENVSKTNDIHLGSQPDAQRDREGPCDVYNRRLRAHNVLAMTMASMR